MLSLMKSIRSLLFMAAACCGGCSKAPGGVPASYPLKTCFISGEAFGGGMGTPFKVTHDGTDVYLCCKSCLKDFQAEPAKYVKMVRDATAQK
jgi:YHS domain-containing protein